MSTNLYLENTEPTVREGRALRTKMAVDFSAASSVTLPATGTGAQTITSASANALTVGPNGTTNPVFNVDGSVTSAVTGVSLQGQASGGNMIIQTTSSGSNEFLILRAKGNKAVAFNDQTGGSGILVGSGSAVTTTVATIQSSNANALVVGPNGSTTPVFSVDASTASAVAGLNVKGAATGGTVALAATDSGSNTSLTIAAKGTGTVTFNPAVVAAAGGQAQSGIQYGSINVGLYTGTGAPTFSAMNGSIYTDSNATTTTTRIYVNKSGAGTAGTTWTNLTTAA